MIGTTNVLQACSTTTSEALLMEVMSILGSSVPCLGCFDFFIATYFRNGEKERESQLIVMFQHHSIE